MIMHSKTRLIVLFAAMALVTKSFGQKVGCSTVQPVHITSFDTAKSRGLADNYYIWNNGATLYVKFLDGSPVLQQNVTSIVKEWENYANIKFAPHKSQANHNKASGYP